jgi:hypothetical protein
LLGVIAALLLGWLIGRGGLGGAIDGLGGLIGGLCAVLAGAAGWLAGRGAAPQVVIHTGENRP